MMTPALAAVCFVIAASIAILLSRPCYYTHLRLYTHFRLKRLGITLDDLKYSFDEIIYIISIPCNNPAILAAPKESYRMEKVILSPVYPELKGVRILLTLGSHEDQMVAYMATDRFRFPLLDKLLLEGSIDQAAYIKFSACKLISPATRQAILHEVHTQIHQHRFS